MDFLFLDTHMGPDLLWFFQDWETKELILANAQQKPSESLTRAKWQRALLIVDPEFFYTVKVCPEYTILCPHSPLFIEEGRRSVPSKYPDLLEDVMNALDVELGPAGYIQSINTQKLMRYKKRREFWTPATTADTQVSSYYCHP